MDWSGHRRRRRKGPSQDSENVLCIIMPETTLPKSGRGTASQLLASIRLVSEFNRHRFLNREGIQPLEGDVTWLYERVSLGHYVMLQDMAPDSNHGARFFSCVILENNQPQNN